MCLECVKPLGIESKEIKNSAIKTGDYAVLAGMEGYYPRLRNDKAWCIPNILKYTGRGEFRNNIFAEVTFSGRRQVSAMALQGYAMYSYGNYIRISYEYDGQFYFHKIDGAEQVIFSFLSLYNGDNGKSFTKETNESTYIITRHLVVFLKAIAILELNRFPICLKCKHI